VPLFEEAAEALIEMHGGDPKMALCQTLALLSGHHKEEMMNRSLLNGQEECVTFQITMEKPFYSVSLIWNIIRRYLPEKISGNIRGMRVFLDNTGACFDVNSADIERFEDTFSHESLSKQSDFKVGRCINLPELKEDERAAGGGYG
jgi:hypothetical protein